MTLAEKQARLTAQLGAIKNGQDRLAHLVEQARKRPHLAPELCTEANLIPGCLAKLWFVAHTENGRCYFACESNSQVVKAVAGLLADFYSDQLPAEILTHNPDFLAPLGITQHLTPNRRNALAKVWDHIRTFAAAQAPRS